MDNMSKTTKDVPTKIPDAPKVAEENKVATISTAEADNIACIYDGSLSAGVMIHKLVKEGKKITILQNDSKAKFVQENKELNIKLSIPTQNISSIVDLPNDSYDNNAVLAYLKECAKYCLDKGIKLLYIPWTNDKMNTNINEKLPYQELFMSGVNDLLLEFEDVKANKFVRPVFWGYPRSNEEMEKNKKQYGL